jgi:hypothetical protein
MTILLAALIALLLGQSPPPQVKTGPPTRPATPADPQPKGSRTVVTPIESVVGASLAWDYSDEYLQGSYVAEEGATPIPYTITAFRVQWSPTVPDQPIGLPVLATLPNGVKTYGVPLPSDLAAGSHTVAVRACPTPAAVPCSDPLTMTFTIDPPPTQMVTVAPSSATGAQTLTITYNCAGNCRPNDWIGMFPKGVNDAELWWPGAYTGGKASGTYTAPANLCTMKECQIRYCVESWNYDCPVGTPFVVSTNGPVDCVVSDWGPWSAWSEWTGIDTTTEMRTRTRRREITTLPANQGIACPPLEETETETRPIAAPLLAPVVNGARCTWDLTADPPSGDGWRAQFQQDNQNVGNADTTAPYTRRVTVDVGGPYLFRVIWTKAGAPDQTTGTSERRCQ